MKPNKPVVADGITVTSVLWKKPGYIAVKDCINLEKNTGEETYWETMASAEHMPLVQTHVLISMS